MSYLWYSLYLSKLSNFYSYSVMFKLNKVLVSLVSHMPNFFTGSLVYLYGVWVVNLKSVSLIEQSLMISVLS